MSTHCICLVVNSSRGHHIVHYHPDIPTPLLDSARLLHHPTHPQLAPLSSLNPHLDVTTSIPILTPYHNTPVWAPSPTFRSKPFLPQLHNFTEESARLNVKAAPPPPTSTPNPAASTASSSTPASATTLPGLAPTTTLMSHLQGISTTNTTGAPIIPAHAALPIFPALSSVPSSTHSMVSNSLPAVTSISNPLFPAATASTGATTPLSSSSSSVSASVTNAPIAVASSTAPPSASSSNSTTPVNAILNPPTVTNAAVSYPSPNPFFTAPLLGIDPYLLSDFLSPKPSNCDKRFELQMNQLVFLGLPVSLTGKRLAKQEIHFPISAYYQHRIARYQSPSATSTSLATNAPSSSPIVKGGERLSMYDDLKAHPDLASPHFLLPPPPTQENKHKFFINMFHLVFIVQEQGPFTPFYLNQLYKYIVRPLTLALQHEQLCREYVRSQAELILSMKDEYSHQPTPESLALKLSKASSLVQLMNQVLHCIQHHEVAHLVINQHLHLTLQLPPTCIPTKDAILKIEGIEDFDDEDFFPSSATPSSFSHCSESPFSSNAFFPIIKPFQSLAWIESKESILKDMCVCNNPTLMEFIKWFEPIHNFEDAHVQLRKPLHQILRYAAHLLFWKKARLIDVISPRKNYIVNPNFPLRELHSLAAQFTHRFPATSLYDTLNALTFFSKANRPKESAVLHFLVSRNVIKELHFYVYLKIPWFIQLGLSLQSFEQLCGAEGQGVLNAAGGVTGPWPRPEERKSLLRDQIQVSEFSWINLIARMHPYQSTFEKVSAFFNGRYNIDEISYRTGVSKKELKTILTLYSSELVILQHTWR